MMEIPELNEGFKTWFDNIMTYDTPLDMCVILIAISDDSDLRLKLIESFMDKTSNGVDKMDAIWNTPIKDLKDEKHD